MTVSFCSAATIERREINCILRAVVPFKLPSFFNIRQIEAVNLFRSPDTDRGMVIYRIPCERVVKQSIHAELCRNHAAIVRGGNHMQISVCISQLTKWLIGSPSGSSGFQRKEGFNGFLTFYFANTRICTFILVAGETVPRRTTKDSHEYKLCAAAAAA